MHWDDAEPRPAINLAAALGAPADPTPFRVCVLRVPDGDPLPAAFAEFWRRVLADGPGQCSDRWGVFVFAMNLLGGGFTCAFTGRDLTGDEPPVFKFASDALEAECYDLPDDDDDGAAHQELEDRCLDQLRAAARAEPAAGLLRDLRARRTFAVEVCDFYRDDRRPLGV